MPSRLSGVVFDQGDPPRNPVAPWAGVFIPELPAPAPIGFEAM